MIDNKKILALIPARGGSKGIKNKNIIDINGKPLIAYTIEAAKKSIYIDDIVVSTDSEKIKQSAAQFGAWIPFLRPAALAKDQTPTLDVVLHTIESLKKMGHTYDIFLLLQPTSPLRTSANIDQALEIFLTNKCQPLAAVTKVSDHPLLIRSIAKDGYMEKLLQKQSTLRRQDMPDYYKLNGSIYIRLISDINEKTSFNDSPVPYIMPEANAVDIDHALDILIVQFYLSRENLS